MNPYGRERGRFALLILDAMLRGDTPEQFADDTLKRWHVEKHGWVPLGRDAADGKEKWTTLERGLGNAVTLDEAAALSGFAA